MRMKRGLSMRGLAQLAGVSPGTISNAEAGREIWADTLHRIARGLNCHVTDLMAPEGETSK